MPKPKDGAHKSSKQYATVCARYSAKLDAWQWGFRLKQGRGVRRVHVHPCRTEQEARDAAYKLTSESRNNALGLADAYRPTLAELIRRYLATLAYNDQLAAARAYRVWLAEWLQDPRLLDKENWLDLLADRIRVDEVKRAHFQHLINAPAAKEFKPGTIKRYLATICAGLNRAGDFFPELEQWRPPKPPKISVDLNPVARTITDDEYARLITWLGNYEKYSGERITTRAVRLQLYWIFRALMLTGMRPIELYSLNWDDYFPDAHKPYLLIRATKTAHKKASVRTIQLSPELRAVIEAQREFASEREYIFTNRTRLNDSTRRVLKLACDACEIAYGRYTERGLLLRFARHTTATHLLNKGFSINQVSRLLGNTPDVLSKHYLGDGHNTADQLSQAISEIEQNRLAKI